MCDRTTDLKPRQLKALRQLVASGLIDQVAVRKDLVDRSARTGAQYRNCRGVAYRAIGVAEDVFIHPSSVVFGRSPPPWVVYQDVVQTSRAYLKRMFLSIFLAAKAEKRCF
jgi:ATP-dependent RNA helicase DHX37/DHR1